MKMNCEQIQLNLLDYGAGLLTGPEAEEVKTHIAQCSECAALLEEEMAFSRHLSCVPSEEPQNDVWAMVRAQTRPRRLSPVTWLQNLIIIHVRRATAAAVTLAIVLVVLYNFMPQPQPSQTQPKHAVAATAVKWSDDPVGQHTDAMLASIDNM